VKDGEQKEERGTRREWDEYYFDLTATLTFEFNTPTCNQFISGLSCMLNFYRTSPLLSKRM